ncbi:hypothetical protein G7046_g6464 [Stylonectria norvegica]|nr:hypothetical protein G7046_g6464 [Stylonectria norvegica]
MGWPYAFVDLTEDEKLLRRDALDHYARVAHYSALAPALAFLLLRLGARVTRARRDNAAQYQAVPGSPAVKARRVSWAALLERRWRAWAWWLGEDVYFLGAHWGHRDEWIMGLAWMGWLLVLCVVGTGKDYLHLTKRFGIIAASQLPIQYLLALKYLNPFAYIFRSSHEQVNRYHRVLGRIIYALLILHAIFYNVFFVKSGIWLKRFFAPIVFAGVVALTLLHALNATAVARVRAFSYRVFFITHLLAAMAIPLLIYFHAPTARFYVVEALAVFVLDLVARKLTTVTAPATIESIADTGLLKITAAMPLNNMAKFRAHPGSHIYLNIPPASRLSGNSSSVSNMVFEFLYNPFTVAATNEESGELTLVARARSGPLTRHLAHLATADNQSSPDRKLPLSIEGPYGAAGKNFSDLVSSGPRRVLLVAGGVGATFAVPIYHALLNDIPAARVQLIWAIRNAGDATWAVSGTSGKSILDDDQVQLFLTGEMSVTDDGDDAAGVEMSALQPRASQRGPRTTDHNGKRPDFQKIVDETFRHAADETVAVLVCGPAEMARELRRCVTPWVVKGRKVWWHNESFGW